MIMKKQLQDLYQYHSDGTFTWRVSRKGVRMGSAAGAFQTYENGDVRCRMYLNGKRYYRSHLVLLWHGIDIPKGYEVDHKNGNTLDDRYENLRVCDRSKNNNNRKAGKLNRKHDLPKWVYPQKNGRFFSRVKHPKGHLVHLGTFDTPEEAYAVAASKAIELHGEFYNSGDLDHEPT